MAKPKKITFTIKAVGAKEALEQIQEIEHRICVLQNNLRNLYIEVKEAPNESKKNKAKTTVGKVAKVGRGVPARPRKDIQGERKIVVLSPKNKKQS